MRSQVVPPRVAGEMRRRRDDSAARARRWRARKHLDVQHCAARVAGLTTCSQKSPVVHLAAAAPDGVARELEEPAQVHADERVVGGRMFAW